MCMGGGGGCRFNVYWYIRTLPSICLVKIDSRSPMVTPSITRFGLSDGFTWEGLMGKGCVWYM